MQPWANAVFFGIIVSTGRINGCYIIFIIARLFHIFFGVIILLLGRSWIWVVCRRYVLYMAWYTDIWRFLCTSWWGIMITPLCQHRYFPIKMLSYYSIRFILITFSIVKFNIEIVICIQFIGSRIGHLRKCFMTLELAVVYLLINVCSFAHFLITYIFSTSLLIYLFLRWFNGNTILPRH